MTVAASSLPHRLQRHPAAPARTGSRPWWPAAASCCQPVASRPC